MRKICQRLLDGNGMPDDWKTTVVVPIYTCNKHVLGTNLYTKRTCLKLQILKVYKYLHKIVYTVREKNKINSELE